MPRDTKECNPCLKVTKLWLTEGSNPDLVVDTAAIPSSCLPVQLGTHLCCRENTTKCNGIYVAEPKCDAEILMQIFCPVFPVSTPFGHQKPQENMTVPETASTGKISMI